MRLSKYFLPTLKENPIDAKITSHQLMIRAGMIRQTSSGIYSWLPLGLKVLKKIENIVRDEINESGCLEILMPTIQPAELWVESGRYNDYGKELLKIKDRHNRDLLYGPTNEEVVTDLFRKNITSYKDLPKNFYQIQWKFRDEIRPRFGVMRGREFLMKDGYSFDVDFESAKKSYNLMYETYFRIFKKMGLDAVAVKADTGAIGGDLSHEFHVLADTGESEVYYDKKFDDLRQSPEIDIQAMQNLYAAADEMHKPETCPIEPDQIASRRGIEVGHIFHFGDKYSKAMKALISDNNGKGINPQMGSYGIGVSRLVAAIIESSFDERGIIWPESVAPFQIALINLKAGDVNCDKICEEIYADLKTKDIETLYDDSKNGAGQKFANMDLIGIPIQIIIGPKGVANGLAEIKYRKSGEKKEVRIDEIISITKVEFYNLLSIKS
ncbi:MAG: prolyl-tRNA synthetase [Rickettsiales bacterium]|jgi:prolyl-tRNA synthetase